jgi:quercetin dioxygenase-like cupin family protein
MSDLFILPGAGRAVDLDGFGVVFKIYGSQNGGLFSVVEHPMAPGVLAAPMHTHTYEDEMSFVLEGEIKALIGEELILAPAGSYVFKPRGIPHTFWNPGNRPARVLELITPAGFEHYFEELLTAFTPGSPPDTNLIMQIASKYGLQLHFDSLEMLSSKYGVTIPGAPPSQA